MRKNTQQVFAAFKAGKSLDMKSISTDGKEIRSYRTPIFYPDGKGQMVLNMKKYSSTTSNQQSAINLMAKENQISFTVES